MFEKIGHAAETMAMRVGESRRGFLGRCVRLGGKLALGTIPFMLPSEALAEQRCNAPWQCKCKGKAKNFGCATQCSGCSNEAICDNDCFVFCFQACSPY